MRNRPETPKGIRTRKNILAAAMKLAARHGFAEASFQMIADEIGLSQSAVMYHYPDKNSLLKEMVSVSISHNHDLVAAMMEPGDSAGRRLLKYCLGNVLWVLRSRKMDGQVLLLLYYLAGRGGASAEIFRGVISTGRERIMAHLQNGLAEGLFRLNGDPAEITETIQDALFGAMLYAASGTEPFDRRKLESKWGDFVASLTGWKNRDRAPLIAARFLPGRGGA